jgi:hypothetical protein
MLRVGAETESQRQPTACRSPPRNPGAAHPTATHARLASAPLPRLGCRGVAPLNRASIPAAARFSAARIACNALPRLANPATRLTAIAAPKSGDMPAGCRGRIPRTAGAVARTECPANSVRGRPATVRRAAITIEAVLDTPSESAAPGASGEAEGHHGAGEAEDTIASGDARVRVDRPPPGSEGGE